MKFVILATLFVASQASLELYGLQPVDMCCWWASLGECEGNAFWMRPNCGSQCGTEGCDVSDAGNCAVSVRSDCVQWNEQSEGYAMWVEAYNRVNGAAQSQQMEQPAAVQKPAPVVDPEMSVAVPMINEGYGEVVEEPVFEEPIVNEPVVEKPIVEEPVEVLLELPAPAPVTEIVEPSGYGMEEEQDNGAPAPLEMSPIEQPVFVDEVQLPVKPVVEEVPLPVEPVVEEVPLPVEPVVEEVTFPVVEPVVEKEGYGSVEPLPLEPVDIAPVGELVNNNKHCMFWASLGECVNNAEYMNKECSLACQ